MPRVRKWLLETKRRRTTLEDFLAQSHSAGRGRVAQRAAEAHLERSGYRIVGRNWTCKAGEIDLVALDRNTLCFIEVKARANPDHGPAIGAVGGRKQRRIANAASMFLVQSGYEGPCRFDVIGLDRCDGGWELTLIRGAFEAP